MLPARQAATKHALSLSFHLPDNVLTHLLLLASLQSHDIIQLFYPICRFGANFCNTHGWQVACLLSVEFCQAAIFGQIMSMVRGWPGRAYVCCCLGWVPAAAVRLR